MSQYTTGELAKACGVTVRTVQYYDTRGILTPGALTEGGRRLYSEDDLRKMKVICFLRDTGLSLNTIGQLLNEEDPGSVISLFIDQQKQALRAEIDAGAEKLRRLEELEKGLRAMKGGQRFSIETIGDAADVMKNNDKRKRMLWTMILISIPISALQWASIILWIKKGIWQPFLVWLALAIPFGIIATIYYYRHISYICPQCHAVFKPSLKEVVFAAHTSKTRKLTCTECGHHGFCVEIWPETEQKREDG